MFIFRVLLFSTGPTLFTVMHGLDIDDVVGAAQLVSMRRNAPVVEPRHIKHSVYMDHVMREDACADMLQYLCSDALSEKVLSRAHAYLDDVFDRIIVRVYDAAGGPALLPVRSCNSYVRCVDRLEQCRVYQHTANNYHGDDVLRSTLSRVRQSVEECVAHIRADVYEQVLDAVSNNKSLSWGTLDGVVSAAVHMDRARFRRNMRIVYEKMPLSGACAAVVCGKA